MNAAATGQTIEIDGAPRLVTLDILRGIAILGILCMNFNAMRQSIIASGRVVARRRD